MRNKRIIDRMRKEIRECYSDLNNAENSHEAYTAFIRALTITAFCETLRIISVDEQRSINYDTRKHYKQTLDNLEVHE